MPIAQNTFGRSFFYFIQTVFLRLDPSGCYDQGPDQNINIQIGSHLPIFLLDPSAETMRTKLFPWEHSSNFWYYSTNLRILFSTTLWVEYPLDFKKRSNLM